MDIFSHALLPYLLGSSLWMKRTTLAALVLGGIAPDLDMPFNWINALHPTPLLLVHRGITHSILFGMLTGLVVLFLSSRAPIRAALCRSVGVDIEFSMASLAFVWAGVFCHLLLDFLTSRGAPLLYPWEATRYSAELFFHTEIALFIASLVILAALVGVRITKGRLPVPALNRRLLVIFVVFFLAVGAARMEGKDAARESFGKSQGMEVFPDLGLHQWAVLEEGESGFWICSFDALSGEVVRCSVFPRVLVRTNGTGLDAAIATAREMPQAKLFAWRAYAIAVDAAFRNGSWSLVFYDPVVVLETQNAWPVIAGVVPTYVGSNRSFQIRVDGG